MTPLPESFTSRGFAFWQVKRFGMVALFRKSKAGKCVSYEVVVIQVDPGGRVFPDGRVSVPREYMPGDELWGTKGFTYNDAMDAGKKFRELSSQSDQEPPPSLPAPSSLPRTGPSSACDTHTPAGSTPTAGTHAVGDCKAGTGGTDVEVKASLRASASFSPTSLRSRRLTMLAGELPLDQPEPRQPIPGTVSRKRNLTALHEL